ncbi:MAG: hypothetical protein ACLTUC_15545 [Anaerobutyricum soehngenii]
MLCEIAWVIAGKRNTYLRHGTENQTEKGAKKAIVALARKLCHHLHNVKTELYLTNPVLKQDASTVNKNSFLVKGMELENIVIMWKLKASLS